MDDLIVNKPMAKAAKKRHIQSRGCDVYEHGCLYCKEGGERDNDQEGVTLDYGELSPVENGDIEQQVICQKCGRKWIDVFRLTDVHEIS